MNSGGVSASFLFSGTSSYVRNTQKLFFDDLKSFGFRSSSLPLAFTRMWCIPLFYNGTSHHKWKEQSVYSLSCQRSNRLDAPCNPWAALGGWASSPSCVTAHFGQENQCGIAWTSLSIGCALVYPSFDFRRRSIAAAFRRTLSTSIPFLWLPHGTPCDNAPRGRD